MKSPELPKALPEIPGRSPELPGAPSGAQRPPGRTGKRSNRPYPAYPYHYFDNHHLPDGAAGVTGLAPP